MKRAGPKIVPYDNTALSLGARKTKKEGGESTSLPVSTVVNLVAQNKIYLVVCPCLAKTSFPNFQNCCQ